MSSKLSWRQETLGMRLRMKWLIQKLWIRKPFFRKLLVNMQVFLIKYARMLCNLVSRCFSLFDMKKYLFCRVLPHINSQKLRGNGIGIPFLTPRTRENNEKLKLSSTNKTHVYSLLVTFDVLRLYVVTKKSKFFGVIFRILIHSGPKILQIFFL